MTLNELVDYPIDVGPYEEPPTPNSEDATPPSSLARTLRSPKTRESQGLRNIERTVRMRVNQRKALKRTPWKWRNAWRKIPRKILKRIPSRILRKTPRKTLRKTPISAKGN